MKRAIQAAYGCGECGSISARKVSLGTLGEGAILSKFQGGCGQGNNCNEFSVLYRFRGEYHIDPVDGAAEVFVVRGSGPVPDVMSATYEPCCEAFFYRVSFRDGRFVESGCDSVEYTGEFGDNRRAKVKDCSH